METQRKSRSLSRSKKYRKEHKKWKSLKQRLTSDKMKLNDKLMLWKERANKLQEKCSQLRARDLQPHASHHHSRTKATMFQCQAITSCQSLPTSCRRLLWNEIEIKDKSGKGAFGSCFIAKLGGMDTVCLKVLHADPKFKFLFYAEVKILLLLCHVNLPWLLGACDSDRHVAIAMTYHPFREGSSATVYDALSRDLSLTSQNWKQVISGVVAALNYICLKNIIHNDIKSDNVLIEMLGSDYTDARAILIDFNKACFLDEAKRCPMKMRRSMQKIILKLLQKSVKDSRNRALQVIFILLVELSEKLIQCA